jgi:hypothetical protein
MWDFALKIPNQLRALRPRAYQTHFPAKPVENLWQFGQTHRPAYASSKDDARITGGIQLRHWAIRTNQVLQMHLVTTSLDIELHGCKFENS